LLDDAEARGLIGLNITHPCKQLVIPYLDDLSPEARALGAVNTVVLRRTASVLATIPTGGVLPKVSGAACRGPI
jgi:shikimate 5-dehydrogenase